jgi:ADP-heptose:LPS heptosyltransferase
LVRDIPSAVNLIGQTNLGDIADLARKARFAIGNDTGPMHLIAAAGCKTITLFSDDSDPALCAPVGQWTRVLRRPHLTDLPVEDVLQSLPVA